MAFANQVAVITGASSGIGWELAKLLAAQKCAVGLLARRQENLARLTEEIRQAGGRAAYAVADVTRRQQTLDAIHTLRQELGPADLLVANSGVGQPTPLEPMDTPIVENMFKVNLFGVIYAIEGVLPEMLERGTGHLVAISSLASYKGFPGESAYCASKAAVNVYMEGLRLQLRKRGIAVTTVCPGFVRTPMTEVNEFPMPWLMNADKAARKILRAIRRKKKVYNFPWQTTLLIRATRWLPDWVVAKVVGKHTKDRPVPPG